MSSAISSQPYVIVDEAVASGLRCSGMSDEIRRWRLMFFPKHHFIRFHLRAWGIFLREEECIYSEPQ